MKPKYARWLLVLLLPAVTLSLLAQTKEIWKTDLKQTGFKRPAKGLEATTVQFWDHYISIISQGSPVAFFDADARKPVPEADLGRAEWWPIAASEAATRPFFQCCLINREARNPGDVVARWKDAAIVYGDQCSFYLEAPHQPRTLLFPEQKECSRWYPFDILPQFLGPDRILLPLAQQAHRPTAPYPVVDRTGKIRYQLKMLGYIAPNRSGTHFVIYWQTMSFWQRLLIEGARDDRAHVEVYRSEDGKKIFEADEGIPATEADWDHPVALSEDGSLLAWVRGSTLHVYKLPSTVGP